MLSCYYLYRQYIHVKRRHAKTFLQRLQILSFQCNIISDGIFEYTVLHFTIFYICIINKKVTL